MVPSVYFFFPETAYRSLEEMDEIFHKTSNFFDVVSHARNMPHRYGKHGELLINYEDRETTSAHRESNVSMEQPLEKGGVDKEEV